MARGGLALLLVLVAAVAIAGAAAIDGVTARPSGGAVGRGRGVGAHRGGGGGFVSGDTLWTMKRTQFGQVGCAVKNRRGSPVCGGSPWSVRASPRGSLVQDQTPWSDVLGRESPKFLVTRKLELPTADVVQESLQTQKPFKMYAPPRRRPNQRTASRRSRRPPRGRAALPRRSMFSFANDQFTTPWLTISDGHGRVLNSVVFTFTYAGDKVVGLRWRLDCTRRWPSVPASGSARG